MPARRIVSALKDLLRFAEAMPGNATIPPPPTQADPPPAWRSHRVLRGPYTCFELHVPRDLSVRQTDGADLLHLEPRGRGTSGTFLPVTSGGTPAVSDDELERRGYSGIGSEADIALTLSWRAAAVHGPQGLLDALEEVLGGALEGFEPGAVRLDRWGDDAWVGSWAWNDIGPDGPRSCWVVVVGHDEAAVTAMLHGTPEAVAVHMPVFDRILGTLRLEGADVLSPTTFPVALCDLLNERAAGIRAPLWELDGDGNLASGSLVVRMASLYRNYLQNQDLDAIAALVDSTPRDAIERRWGGLPWEQVAPHVRVVLRRAEAVSDLAIVTVPLPGGLVACPVLDSGDHMTFIPAGESDRWGVDGRDLLTSAVARLDREDPEVVIAAADEDGMPSGLMLAADDGYDSGRLLCPRFRDQLETALGGPLLVAMPSAWTIHIWRDTPRARRALGAMAEEGYGEEPTPLSKLLWRWDEAGLSPVE